MSVADVNRVIIGSCLEYLRGHFGLTVTAGQPKMFLRTAVTPHFVNATIPVQGSAAGLVCASMPNDTAFGLVERVLHERPTSLGPLVNDVVGEFVNTLVGMGRRELNASPQHALTMGLPSVVYGRGRTLEIAAESSIAAIPLTTCLGPLVLITALAATESNQATEDDDAGMTSDQLAQQLRNCFGDAKAISIHVSPAETGSLIPAALIGLSATEMTIIVNEPVSESDLRLELSRHIPEPVSVHMTVTARRPVAKYMEVRGPYFIRSQRAATA